MLRRLLGPGCCREHGLSRLAIWAWRQGRDYQAAGEVGGRRGWWSVLHLELWDAAADLRRGRRAHLHMLAYAVLHRVNQRQVRVFEFMQCLASLSSFAYLEELHAWKTKYQRRAAVQREQHAAHHLDHILYSIARSHLVQDLLRRFGDDCSVHDSVSAPLRRVATLQKLPQRVEANILKNVTTYLFPGAPEHSKSNQDGQCV